MRTLNLIRSITKLAFCSTGALLVTLLAMMMWSSKSPSSPVTSVPSPYLKSLGKTPRKFEKIEV